jgi:hypothetical protein
MSAPNQGPFEPSAPASDRPTHIASTGWPQHGQSEQSQANGTPSLSSGGPFPSYGDPGPVYYGAPLAAADGVAWRPRTVTTAGILALVTAAINLVIGLACVGGAMYMGSQVFKQTDEAAGVGRIMFAVFFTIVGVISLLIGGLFIGGGVAALKGSTNKVLIGISSTAMVWHLISATAIIAAVGEPATVFPWLGVNVVSTLCIALYGAILVLVLTRSSKAFFLAHGGMTF